jgi:hypothetical protein
MGNRRKEYCFAFIPTYIGGNLIWWKWYLKIYQYKDVDIIHCDSTNLTERCTITPGYKEWVLIDKKIIDDNK